MHEFAYVRDRIVSGRRGAGDTIREKYLKYGGGKGEKVLN